MYRQILKSKLKQVTVTDSQIKYEGSLILDPELIRAARLVPYERVEVNSVIGQERAVTYVIEGKEGDVIIAGGLANLFKKGDKIHVNCFAMAGNHEEISITVVYTDEQNKISGINIETCYT